MSARVLGLPLPSGVIGPTGPTGPTGDTGPTGPTGPETIGGLPVVLTNPQEGDTLVLSSGTWVNTPGA